VADNLTLGSSHQRDGFLASLNEQPREPRFQIGRKCRAVHSLDGWKIGWQGRADFEHIESLERPILVKTYGSE
jgi:hypothetical protein